MKKQPTNLADNLRKLRYNHNYSQDNIADMLDINRETYASWELGTEPKLYMLIILAKTFNVTVDQLLTTLP